MFIDKIEARTLTLSEVEEIFNYTKEYRTFIPIFLETKNGSWCYWPADYWNGYVTFYGDVYPPEDDFYKANLCCLFFGTDEDEDIQVSEYGKTWVAWTREPPKELLGKYLEADK